MLLWLLIGTFTNFAPFHFFHILLCYFGCLFSYDDLPTEDTSLFTYIEIDLRTAFTLI